MKDNLVKLVLIIVGVLVFAWFEKIEIGWAVGAIIAILILV